MATAAAAAAAAETALSEKEKEPLAVKNTFNNYNKATQFEYFISYLRKTFLQYFVTASAIELQTLSNLSCINRNVYALLHNEKKANYFQKQFPDSQASIVVCPKRTMLSWNCMLPNIINSKTKNKVFILETSFVDFIKFVLLYTQNLCFNLPIKHPTWSNMVLDRLLGTLIHGSPDIFCSVRTIDFPVSPSISVQQSILKLYPSIILYHHTIVCGENNFENRTKGFVTNSSLLLSLHPFKRECALAHILRGSKVQGIQYSITVAKKTLALSQITRNRAKQQMAKINTLLPSKLLFLPLLDVRESLQNWLILYPSYANRINRILFTYFV